VVGSSPTDRALPHRGADAQHRQVHLADVLLPNVADPRSSAAAFSTVAVSASYMMAQMIGRQPDQDLDPVSRFGIEAVVQLDDPGTKLDPSSLSSACDDDLRHRAAWSRRHGADVKAVMLMSGAVLLSFLVLLHSLQLRQLLRCHRAREGLGHKLNFTQRDPVQVRQKQSSASTALLDNISSGWRSFSHRRIPHILMRFFTVPDAKRPANRWCGDG